MGHAPCSNWSFRISAHLMQLVDNPCAWGVASPKWAITVVATTEICSAQLCKCSQRMQFALFWEQKGAWICAWAALPFTGWSKCFLLKYLCGLHTKFTLAPQSFTWTFFVAVHATIYFEDSGRLWWVEIRDTPTHKWAIRPYQTPKPSALSNGVHFSAGALEGMRERML
jgi:hypothetical protein